MGAVKVATRTSRWYTIPSYLLLHGYLVGTIVAAFMGHAAVAALMLVLWMVGTMTASLSWANSTFWGQVMNLIVGTTFVTLIAWGNSPLWSQAPYWALFMPYYLWLLLHIVYLAAPKRQLITAVI